MNLKDSIRNIFKRETAPAELPEEFIYDPSEWQDRDPKIGANRVIRIGGGVRTCVFPVPHDNRYMPSYLQFVGEFSARRDEFNEARNLGSVAINNEN